ncbi:MAG: hypothetical protein L0227_12940, partial [Chloroflexi bacterium]|nr:hypothetical protein [Chloroflexota bacterium]
DYFVWIRGWATSPGERNSRDEVAIEFPEGRLGKRCPSLTDVENAFLYNGFSIHAGYGWIGGRGEGLRDEPALTVRFPRPGPQTLKLYAIEAPMRVDAIWLSSTQKTRPPADQGPPR